MNIDLGTIETLTKLADQFGPFLFAILFILFVPRVARGYYVACMTRTAPPAGEQEQKTYRFYFVTSIVVGIAVMVASIGWWIYAQARGNHVYQIAIVDLAPDETVLSDYFYKNSPRPTIADVQPMHDSFFLIVRDRPFEVGETVRFQYFKIPRDPSLSGQGVSGRSIELKYGGGTKLQYRVKPAAEGPRLELVANSDRAEIFTAEDLRAARSIYASTPSPSALR
jgi:hypothetical protein